jgi:hypothetical protein
MQVSALLSDRIVLGGNGNGKAGKNAPPPPVLQVRLRTGFN